MALFSAYYPFTRAQYLLLSDNYPAYQDDGVFAPFLFTAANYGNGAWYYESILLSDGTNTVYSALFNTAGTQLANSEISTTSSNNTLQRSAAITMTDGDVYHPRLRTSTTITTDWGPVIPRLIFDANYTEDAPIESHIGLYGEFSFVVWGTEFSPFSDDYALNSDLFLYTPEHWEEGTLFYNEVWMRSRNATYTAEAGIAASTDYNTFIPNSIVSTTSTTFARYRSAAFTPTANKHHATLLASTGIDINTGVELSHSKIIAIVPNARKFELHHPLSSGYLNSNHTSYVKYTASRLRFNEATWSEDFVKNIWLEAVAIPPTGEIGYQALSYWTGPTTDAGTLTGSEIQIPGSTFPQVRRSTDQKALLFGLGFSAIMQARWRVSGAATTDFLSGGKLIYRYDRTWDLDLSPDPALTTGFDIDIAPPDGIYQVNRSAGGSVGAVSSIATNAALHTDGNLLVAFISRQSATAITVTDTAGNTWQQLGTDYQEAGNPNVLAIWYAYNITGNAANIVTATLTSGTGAYFVIGVREFAGFGASDPGGAFAGADGNGTTASTSSLAITGASALIFSGSEHDLESIVAGSGFYGNTLPAGGYFHDQYKVVTAAQAATTTGPSADWRIVGGVFNLPVGTTTYTASVVDTISITDILPTEVATYYFDASDGGPTDTNAVWTNDANAFDGNTATYATVSADGSTSINFLLGQGTNATAGTYNPSSIRARVHADGGAIDGNQITAAIYSDGLSSLLGSPTYGSIGAGWSSYVPLTTLGALTWTDIQAYEVKIYGIDFGVGAPLVSRVEIEVTSGGIRSFTDPVSGSTASVSDTVTITESTTQELSANNSLVDTVGITESVATLNSIDQNVNDTVAISEATTQELNHFVSVFDAVAITETVDSVVFAEASVFDAVAISEDVASELNHFVSGADNITITEDVIAFRVDPSFDASVFDAVGIAELVTTDLTLEQNAVDTIAITEDVVTHNTIEVTVVDTVSITEDVSLVLNNQLEVFDVVTITELLTVERSIDISVFDVVAIAEAVTTETATDLTAFDSVAITDEATLLLGDLAVDTFDDVSVVDIATAVIEGGGFAGDDVVITEFVNLQLIQTDYDLAVFDDVAITEDTAQENNLFAEAALTRFYPQVRATATSGNGSNVSMDVVLPTGYQVGDLLIIALSHSGNNVGVSAPSGWTELATTGALSRAYWKIATGSEGTFVDVGNLLVRAYGAISYAIMNHNGATPVEATGNGGGDINPPSLDPSWSPTIDALWITFATTQGTIGTFTAGPTGFTNLLVRESADNIAPISSAGIASAQLEASSETLDPDAFTYSGSLSSATARTLVIQGAETISQNVSPVTISELVTTQVESSASVFDTVAIAEDVSLILTLNLEVFDSIGVTENVETSNSIFLEVSDDVVLTEDMASEVVFTTAVFDTVGITEDIASEFEYALTVFDLVSITESLELVNSIDLSVADNISITDFTSGSTALEVNVFDVVTATENVATLLEISILQVDTVAITEVVTSFVEISLSIIEPVTITEAVTSALAIDLEVAETITITEFVDYTLERFFSLDIFETVGVTEDVRTENNVFATVVETLNLAENINQNQIFNAQLLWDSITIQDVVTNTDTIRFSPEPRKYRPRGVRGDVKGRGIGSRDVFINQSGSVKPLRSKGSVISQ